MASQIPVFAEPDAASEIPVLAPDSPRPPDAKTVKSRAERAHYGLGINSPGKEQLRAGIAGGIEALMRQQAAASEDIAWQERKNKIIGDYISKRGGSISPQELTTLQTMSKEDFQNDPNTIFEKKFAERYMTDQATKPAAQVPEGVWGEAFKRDPEGTASWIRYLQGKTKLQQFYHTQYENLENERQGRGYLSGASDALWTLVPGSWYNMYNRIGGSPAPTDVLPGEHMRQQIEYLHSLPDDQQPAAFMKAIEQIKSVSLFQAIEFAKAATGYSTSDQFIANIVGIADLTFGVQMAGKAAGAAIGKSGLLTRLPPKPLTPPIPELQQTPGGVLTLPKEQLELFSKEAMGPEQLPLPGFGYKMPEQIKPTRLDQIEALPSHKTGEKGRFGARQPKEALFEAEVARVAEGKAAPEVREALRKGEQAYEFDLPRGDIFPRQDPTSGRIQRSKNAPGFGTPTQRELDLQGGEGQRGFDFGGTGGMRKPPGEAPPAAPSTPPPPAPSPGAAEAAKGVMQGVGLDGKMEPKIISSRAGDAEVASILGAQERASKRKPGEMHLVEDLSSWVNPGDPFGNSSVLGKRRGQEIWSRLQAQWGLFNSEIDRLMRVNKLSPEAITKGVAETSERIKSEAQVRWADGVFDAVHIPAENHLANVDVVVLRMYDMKTKLPFGSETAARNYAVREYGLEAGEFNIYQQGSSFYIGVPTPVNIHSDGVLDVVRAGVRGATPTSMLNPFLSRIRSAADLLSPEQRAMRHAATHPQQQLRKVVSDFGEPFRKLGRRKLAELDEMLSIGRDFEIIRDGVPSRGIWFETADEFERMFRWRFKKAPTIEQVDAYYQYRQLSDMDATLRNIGLFRDMANLGVEQWSLRTQAGKTEFFNGVAKENIPWGDKQDATILLWDANKQDYKFGLMHQADQGVAREISKAEVDKLIKEGWKVIQVYDPKPKFLNKHFPDVNQPVNYVVTNGYGKKPLAWQQLDYRPGGHVIYPYQFYVKQPVVLKGIGGKEFYYGDNSAANFSTRAEAQRWSDRMNTAAKMLKENAPDVDKYIRENLPYTPEQFRKQFDNVGGTFSLDRPFSVAESGANVFSSDEALKNVYPNVVNMSRSKHDLTNLVDRTFLQEKNNILSTFKDSNGIYQVVPAKQLSPLAALQQGLNQSIRSMWSNDYKTGAVTQWLEEHGNLLRGNRDDWRGQPMYHFFHGQYDNLKASGMSEQRTAAEASRRAIINFLGQESEIGQALNGLQTRLMNTVFEKGGQGWANHFADYHLSFIKDPASYMRGAAFHLKLGLFNPIQFLLQAQIVNHSIGIAGPQHAIPGVAAGYYMRRLAYTADENIIRQAAKNMEAFGWKAEDFIEMYDAFRRTGVYQVSTEVATRDTMFDPKLFKSAYGTILDKGSWFFNEGERAGRLVGHAIAYREWKAANKGVRYGSDAQIAQVMDRADLLTGNMTRASLADYQNGILSLTTQFMTFHARIAEQMLGKRLTAIEKARLVGTYSMLYGLPVGFGIGGVASGLAGFLEGTVAEGPLTGLSRGAQASIGFRPIWDDVYEEAQKRGWDMSPAWKEVAMNGIIGGLTAWITGKHTDISKQYGPGGNTFIRDLIRQDKSAVEVARGASGSILKDIWDATDPLWAKMTGVIFGNDEFGPLQPSDYMRLVREVAVADLGVRIWAAFKHGQYLSKAGDNVANVDNMDAVLSTLRLTPAQVLQHYHQIGSSQDTKNIQDYYEKRALDSMKRGTEALQTGDSKSWEGHMKDAQGWMKWGDFNLTKQRETWDKARNALGPLSDRTDRNYVRRAPESQQESRRRRYIESFPDHYINKQRQ